MELTFLGHACVFLNGERSVLVDPYTPEGVPLPDPDIVAVTHGHADHLGETVRLKKPTVCINELAKYLKSKGVPSEGIELWGIPDP